MCDVPVRYSAQEAMFGGTRHGPSFVSPRAMADDDDAESICMPLPLPMLLAMPQIAAQQGAETHAYSKGKPLERVFGQTYENEAVLMFPNEVECFYFNYYDVR